MARISLQKFWVLENSKEHDVDGLETGTGAVQQAAALR
jgi:hypothetical protein